MKRGSLQVKRCSLQVKTESNPGLAPHGGHPEKMGGWVRKIFLPKEHMLGLPRVSVPEKKGHWNSREGG